MNRSVLIALCAIGCLVFLLVHTSDLKAPEITEHDIFGYDPFHVAASGAIVDKDGVIHGWVKGNTVFDREWNARYRIRGRKINNVTDSRQM
ncbi:MAG TPA: hypothetical protein VHO84_01250 [Syntrophorhabdaceae bacterium]|nr:hypothetical protein [Syntrophorhabdaceae bacterium]